MIVKTPPMGWNSWNTFGGNINEELIKTTADTMVNEGYLDAGYEYLVIDDCWSKRVRNEKGELEPDPEKFPNGMKAVADYVHSKGLKFGMYSCAGNYTCAVYPGSYEYEFIDARTFAEWGVDYLKYDYCFKPAHEHGKMLYRRMGLALANCGRDILFSGCSWGADETHKWIKETGAHMWRSTGDIVDSWASIKELYEKQLPIVEYNGQGCFNDMDMLVVGMNGKGNVGVGGCTLEEYKTHFSLWALFGSPLMMGCDIRSCSPEIKAILQDKDIIAIDQDEAYRQPYLVCDYWGISLVWARHLSNGDLLLGMFNMKDNPITPFIPFSSLGLNRSTGKGLQIYDLWEKKDLGTFKDIFRSEKELAPHSCRMLRCKIVDVK